MIGTLWEGFPLGGFLPVFWAFGAAVLGGLLGAWLGRSTDDATLDQAFGQVQLSILKSCAQTDSGGQTWMVAADMNQIRMCHVVVCVPKPIFLDASSSPIVYNAEGGIGPAVLTTGVATSVDAIGETDESFSSWSEPGAHAIPRTATGSAVLADGLRLLVVGPTTQMGDDPTTGELYTAK